MNLTHSYQTLPDLFYKKVTPTTTSQPKLVLFNVPLANSLNLANALNIGTNINEQINSNALTNWLSGNLLPNTAQPIAQAYVGHQFGQLTMLGDGRAILLGELETKTGLIDIQLKGSGVTPYSRSGDGKATLVAMLREYLISEAMHALGIPTTRSLAVVSTGEQIYRNGQKNGAVLTRTASSHIRVGTFVYASILDVQANQNKCKNLLALLDYTVNRHYPKFNDLTTSQKALALLEQVISCQAKLVANWQRVGFIHGVMNTDNITISGETIDYGPCAFMDAYNEQTVFSSIDYQGRYAYKNQMPIMWWNMARFAESLIPLINDDSDKATKMATNVLNKFGDYFNKEWSDMLCKKAGLLPSEDNKLFVNELLSIMQDNQYDHTNTFKDLTRLLMRLSVTDINAKPHQIADLNTVVVESVNDINDTFIQNSELFAWLTRWYKKVIHQAQENNHSIDNAIKQMQLSNPVIIPRNHLVEVALSEAETGDLSKFNALLAVLQTPYDWVVAEQLKDYQQPATPEWSNNYKTYCGT